MKVNNRSARAYFIGDLQVLSGQLVEITDPLKNTHRFTYAANKGELLEATSAKVIAIQKTLREEKSAIMEDKK